MVAQTQIPKLIGLYTVVRDDDNLVTKQVQLNIFEREEQVPEFESYEDWKASLDTNQDSNDSGWSRLNASMSFDFQEWEDSILIYSSCYVRKIQYQLYMLQIRQFSVMLWRIPMDVYDEQQDLFDSAELLFIHAFKGRVFTCADVFEVDTTLETESFYYFLKKTSECERLLVHTKFYENSEDYDERRIMTYSDEIFLPLELFKTDPDVERLSKFDSLFFRGACMSYVVFGDYVLDDEFVFDYRVVCCFIYLLNMY
jgi:hypothetical protein